ncbi:hypothetical protein STEG23_010605, partial [Scotinomys teguina]
KLKKQWNNPSEGKTSFSNSEHGEFPALCREPESDCNMRGSHLENGVSHTVAVSQPL